MRDAVPPYETIGGAEQVRDARTAPDDRPADPAALQGPADPLDAEGPAGITTAPRDLTT